ncbi:MAG TPA: NfeD family protein [Candidatus Acidoferrales bacterium]|jgi:membrane protein implicated in regulation of membrane protease activity|nr:NfeD family protein [Candidatus Acidoferrales bacterium]
MIIYAICLVVGLVFTLISAFLGHFFGGHDSVGAGGHADAGFNADGVPGITFFSPTVLASFMTAFGAIGLVVSEIPSMNSVWISAPVSLVGAWVIALAVLWLFNLMFRKTESSSEGKVGQLVGQTAAIISPIPENGVGEISYTQFGSRYTAPARNEKGGAIPNGKTVKITRIVGTQFYVEAAN